MKGEKTTDSEKGHVGREGEQMSCGGRVHYEKRDGKGTRRHRIERGVGSW